MFTLYTTPLSANGRKVVATCRQLGLAPEIVDVDVYRGEGQAAGYLAVNRSGKIPVLVEGALTLPESNAILTYVAEAHGDGRLGMRDARGRAEAARWMFWEASQWQPALIALLAPYVGHYLRTRTLPAEIDVSWDDARFQRLAHELDAHLAGRSFLVGDELTVADFSVAGLMMYVRLARFPFDAFPGIRAWFERIEGTEGWRATGAGPWA
jgi:glutathione S-transferase